MSEPVPRTPLFLAACGGMFMFGIVLALLGTVFGLPAFRERLQMDFAQQGNLFPMLYAGILVANLVVGPLIDRRGHRLVVLGSSLIVALALAGFGLAASYPAAAAAALLLGIGGGALNTAANALVSDLYEAERSAKLNQLGIFLGIGALFMPFLAASLEEKLSVSQMLYMAAGLAVLSLLSFAVLSFPPARGTGSTSLVETLRVARYPGVVLFAVVLFFQSGNESAVAGWTSTYLGTRGADPRTATWVLSGYWAGLILGRLLSAQLLQKVSKTGLVLVSSAGAAAGCVLLLAAPSIALLAVAVFFIGVCFAGIFPTVLGIAGDRYAEASGRVFGLLFAVAVCGGMLFPWAIGQIGQHFVVRAGMALPILGTLAICILMGIISRRERA